MNIVIYFLSGVLLTLVFKFFDRYFSRHIFSQDTLIIGRFIYRHPLLSALMPLGTSFILTIILNSNSRIEFVLPGFISSFCIVWPKLYAPEILPTEAIKKRVIPYLLFIWLIFVFSIFSYVGGALGARYIDSTNYTTFEPTTSYTTWVMVGLALTIFKRFIKL